MLTTNSNVYFDLEVSDSTVYVRPGATRLNTSVMSWRGGAINFADMTGSSLDSSKYFYSALSLYDHGGNPDMSCSRSAGVSTLRELTFPVSDTISKPLGLFTFFSADGTALDLISYTKAV